MIPGSVDFFAPKETTRAWALPPVGGKPAFTTRRSSRWSQLVARDCLVTKRKQKDHTMREREKKEERKNKRKREAESKKGLKCDQAATTGSSLTRLDPECSEYLGAPEKRQSAWHGMVLLCWIPLLKHGCAFSSGDNGDDPFLPLSGSTGLCCFFHRAVACELSLSSNTPHGQAPSRRPVGPRLSCPSPACRISDRPWKPSLKKDPRVGEASLKKALVSVKRSERSPVFRGFLQGA